MATSGGSSTGGGGASQGKGDVVINVVADTRDAEQKLDHLGNKAKGLGGSGGGGGGGGGTPSGNGGLTGSSSSEAAGGKQSGRGQARLQTISPDDPQFANEIAALPKERTQAQKDASARNAAKARAAKAQREQEAANAGLNGSSDAAGPAGAPPGRPPRIGDEQFDAAVDRAKARKAKREAEEKAKRGAPPEAGPGLNGNSDRGAPPSGRPPAPPTPPPAPPAPGLPEDEKAKRAAQREVARDFEEARQQRRREEARDLQDPSHPDNIKARQEEAKQYRREQETRQRQEQQASQLRQGRPDRWDQQAYNRQLIVARRLEAQRQTEYKQLFDTLRDESIQAARATDEFKRAASTGDVRGLQGHPYEREVTDVARREFRERFPRHARARAQAEDFLEEGATEEQVQAEQQAILQGQAQNRLRTQSHRFGAKYGSALSAIGSVGLVAVAIESAVRGFSDLARQGQRAEEDYSKNIQKTLFEYKQGVSDLGRVYAETDLQRSRDQEDYGRQVTQFTTERARTEQQYIRTTSEFVRNRRLAERQFARTEEEVTIQRQNQARSFGEQYFQLARQVDTANIQYTRRIQDLQRNLQGVVIEYTRQLVQIQRQEHELEVSTSRRREDIQRQATQLNVQHARAEQDIALQRQRVDVEFTRRAEDVALARTQLARGYGRQQEDIAVSQAQLGRGTSRRREDIALAGTRESVDTQRTQTRLTQDIQFQRRIQRSEDRLRLRDVNENLRRNAAQGFQNVGGLIGAAQSGDVFSIVGALERMRETRYERGILQDQRRRGGLTQPEQLQRRQQGVERARSQEDIDTSHQRALEDIGKETKRNDEDYATGLAAINLQIKRNNEDYQVGNDAINLQIKRNAEDQQRALNDIDITQQRTSEDLLVGQNDIAIQTKRNLEDWLFGIQGIDIALQNAAVDFNRNIETIRIEFGRATEDQFRALQEIAHANGVVYANQIAAIAETDRAERIAQEDRITNLENITLAQTASAIQYQQALHDVGVAEEGAKLAYDRRMDDLEMRNTEAWINETKRIQAEDTQLIELHVGYQRLLQDLDSARAQLWEMVGFQLSLSAVFAPMMLSAGYIATKLGASMAGEIATGLGAAGATAGTGGAASGGALALGTAFGTAGVIGGGIATGLKVADLYNFYNQFQQNGGISWQNAGIAAGLLSPIGFSSTTIGGVIEQQIGGPLIGRIKPAEAADLEPGSFVVRKDGVHGRVISVDSNGNALVRYEDGTTGTLSESAAPDYPSGSVATNPMGRPLDTRTNPMGWIQQAPTPLPGTPGGISPAGTGMVASSESGGVASEYESGAANAPGVTSATNAAAAGSNQVKQNFQQTTFNAEETRKKFRDALGATTETADHFQQILDTSQQIKATFDSVADELSQQQQAYQAALAAGPPAGQVGSDAGTVPARIAADNGTGGTSSPSYIYGSGNSVTAAGPGAGGSGGTGFYPSGSGNYFTVPKEYRSDIRRALDWYNSTSGHRAYGGPVVPGQSYMVGERGPEMFQSAASGHIDSGESNLSQLKKSIDDLSQAILRGDPTKAVSRVALDRHMQDTLTRIVGGEL